MKRILQIWGRFSFQKKILCLCLMVSLIPVTVLGLFSYAQIQDLLLTREEKAIEETLFIESNRIDGVLSSCQTAMDHILWNENIQDALLQEYTSVSEMYLVYRDVIDPFFLTIRSLTPVISNVCIYTEHYIFPHGANLLNITEAQSMPWYQEVSLSSHSVYALSQDGKTLYLAQKMYLNSPETSIICISIDVNQLFQSSQYLSESHYAFWVTDSQHMTIYLHSTLPEDSLPILTQVSDADSYQDFIIKQQELETAGFTLTLLQPTSTIYSAIQPIENLVYLVIIICASFALYCSFRFSNIIVTPLQHLTESMDHVEQGNYSISLEATSNDEVGKLVKAFNSMTSELNHQINEVLRAQIALQKYELEILTAKINPHFLYNCLSQINTTAILSGQTDISRMTLLLSTFYRTLLNRGSSITSIENELENVKSYIEIQLLIHNNSFDVVYDIDESLLSFQLPNLVLQPLAENAILHGLDCKTHSDRGVLTICCYQEDDDIVLQVMDNGCGMSEQMLQNILTSQSRGYGISNVQHRIQLFYGEPYGLTYRSTPQVGTSVLLRISRQLPDF